MKKFNKTVNQKVFALLRNWLKSTFLQWKSMRIRDRKENTKAHCWGKKKQTVYIFQRPGVNYLCKIWMHNYLMQRLLFCFQTSRVRKIGQRKTNIICYCLYVEHIDKKIWHKLTYKRVTDEENKLLATREERERSDNLGDWD